MSRLYQLTPGQSNLPPRFLSSGVLQIYLQNSSLLGLTPPDKIQPGPHFLLEPDIFLLRPNGSRLPPILIPDPQLSTFAASLAKEFSLTPVQLQQLRNQQSLPGIISLTSFEVSRSNLFFLLGTDPLGRDLLQRIFEGGRISLAVGLCATLVAVLIGVLYGATAGYLGGRIDGFMMRIVDAAYAIPFIIFVILLVVVFDRNLLLIFAAIGAVEWLTMARIVRGQVLALKDRPFVDAARISGASDLRIVFVNILPNCLGVIIVYTTLTVPSVILLESVLSFLGLGVPPPISSWGILIKEGSERVLSEPWLLVAPALFFAATLFSLNFLGDSLHDAANPHHN